MAGVDDRVVGMEFDNNEFERRLSTTLSSLDKLDQSIQMIGAKQGLTQIASAADTFDMSRVGSAIENISSKFSAMGAIGFSVIQSLTQSVMGFASHMINIAKTDILGPIISGGTTRAQNIEQAQFQFRGLGIDVDAAMKSALAAVQGTAYGLDEAAKIAAQFGASGMKAGDDMTGALRGIAGAAAMTGTSFSEIGDIFAQSAATGVVNTQDLQQFATRGLNAAAAIAQQMHISEAAVRDLASNGKLDFATFAKAMDGAFGAHATEANQTYAGSLSNLHAAMSRLGASFEGPKMTQQRDLFNTLTPVVDNLNKAVQPLIQAFLQVSQVGNDRLIAFLKKLDFTKYADSFTMFAHVIRGVSTIIRAVFDSLHDGFREIFPSDSVNNLKTIATFFLALMNAINPAPKTIDEMKRIFAGLFAILDIGWTVIKGVVGVIAELLGHLQGVGAGPLAFSAHIGDLLVKFDQMLVKGGAIDRFFASLGKRYDELVVKLKPVTDEFKKLEAQAVHLYDQLTAKTSPVVVGFKEIEDGAQHLYDLVQKFFHGFEGIEQPAIVATNRVEQRFSGLAVLVGVLEQVFAGIFKVLAVAGYFIGKWFSELGKNIAAAIKPGDFDAAVDTVNVGLIGGLVLMFKKFMKIEDNFDITHGLFDKAKSALDELKGTLKAMQTEVKAEALLKIAEAVALLTVSVVVLSLIDSEALTKAMTALAVGFGQLVGAMKLLDLIASNAQGAAKLALLATAMTILAGGAVILAVAVRILAGLSWEELARGMSGVAAMLALLIGASQLMASGGPGMIAASIAMVAVATALSVMAGAVALFGAMSWATMAKGLVGVTAVLVILSAAVSEMPIPSILAAGIAMIPLATGITILAGAVALFGMMSLTEMAKGLGAMFLALAVVAVAMEAMPLTLPITAAGLILVGIALGIMAGAVKMMGSQDLATLGKGLGAITVLLLILSAAMSEMEGALPGAAALVVAAVALSVLAGVMATMGKLSWTEIAKGMVAIAGVMVVLGLAALLLEPVIPTLLGLGIAMTLVGAGFALFGAGAYMVGKAITVLAAAGKAGINALIASINAILVAIPMFVATFLGSLIKASGDLLNSTQLMLNILTVLLVQVLNTVITLAPKIAEALVAIITSAMLLIRAKFPDVLATAFDLLMTLLRGIRDHMVEVTTVAVEIMLAFAATLTANVQKLTDAAITLVLAFVFAIAQRVNDIEGAGLFLLLSFITAMINNMFKIVDYAVSVVIVLAQTIANEVWRLVVAGANILIKFVEGIAGEIERVTHTGVDVIIKFLEAIGGETVRLARGAAEALIDFLNGLSQAIDDEAPRIREAGLKLAVAIVSGVTGGLLDPRNVGSVIDAAKNLVKNGYEGAKDWLLSRSPSKRFMELGQNMALGVAVALDADTTAQNSAVSHAERIVQAFSETLSRMPSSFEGLDASPVITPVLDLTQVKAAASGLSSLLPNPSITPDMSLAQARTIAATAETPGTAPTPPPSGPTEIKFEQNNYSPEALSTGELYRQTKSQLALAKEELKI